MTQNLPDGFRKRGGLEQVERNAEKERAGTRSPEGVHVRRIRIEHLRDALQVVYPSDRILRHIEERIPPSCPSFLGKRIEQEALLPIRGAKPGRQRPVLALDVDAND